MPSRAAHHKQGGQGEGVRKGKREKGKGIVGRIFSLVVSTV